MLRNVIIVSLVLLPLVRADSLVVTTQVCSLERQTIACANNSVIYVDAARYGRMGGCGTNPEFGFFNCSADVHQYMERRCSGRRSCLIEPDSALDRSPNGCPADLRSYLEIKHHCLRVETPRIADPSKCTGKKYPVGMATSDGYLARVVTIETGIGSSTCPWSIEAKSGQSIRLRLYDFGTWQDPNKVSHSPGNGIDAHGARTLCQVYATITERSGTTSPWPLCGGGSPVDERLPEQGRWIYTSNSNSVQVTVTTTSTNIPALEQFLIRYEVVGCADPIPPPARTSVERISDRLVLKCTTDDGLDSETKPWILQCQDDGNWSIPLHEVNCTTSATGKHKPPTDFPLRGIILTVAISAAVIVAVLVFTCGLFVLYRRRVSKQEEESQIPLPADDYRCVPSTGPTSGYASWAQPQGGPYAPGGSSRSLGGAGLDRRPSADCLERDYATTLQMRLNAMPCSSSSPSFSSGHVPASAAGPYGLPYDPRTMMVYCPYHGTLTRVNGAEPERARLRSEHRYEEVPLQATLSSDGTDAEDGDARILQHQHSGLYQELNC